MKLLTAVLLPLTALVLNSDASKSPKTKFVIEFHWIKNCTDYKGSPNYLANIGIVRPTRDKFFIDYDVLVNEKGANNLKGLFVLYKCDDRIGKNCEYYLKIPFDDFCRRIVERGKIWSPFFVPSSPPLVCPLKVDHYRVRNATFDLDQLLELGRSVPQLTEIYWKGIGRLYKSNRPWICLGYMSKINMVRV